MEICIIKCRLHVTWCHTHVRCVIHMHTLGCENKERFCQRSDSISCLYIDNQYCIENNVESKAPDMCCQRGLIPDKYSVHSFKMHQ